MQVRGEREWLTAAEAASEQLPGFAFTKQHIRRILAQGTIKSRRRTARGGGQEFHYADMPREAAAEYAKRYGVASAELPDDPRAREIYKDLVAEARRQIVLAFQEWYENEYK